MVEKKKESKDVSGQLGQRAHTNDGAQNWLEDSEGFRTYGQQTSVVGSWWFLKCAPVIHKGTWSAVAAKRSWYGAWANPQWWKHWLWGEM